MASGATGSGSDSDVLAAQAALAVTKTDGSAAYTPGGVATYTIVATNGGPSDALNTTVSDALPSGVTLTANAICVAAGSRELRHGYRHFGPDEPRRDRRIDRRMAPEIR